MYGMVILWLPKMILEEYKRSLYSSKINYNFFKSHAVSIRMKDNKIFIFILVALLALYIVAQLNQPKKFDWMPTLRNNDKNPFGAFIPYAELKQLFAIAHIQSHKIPLYNVLHNSIESESAYILLEPEFDPGKVDLEELLKYVQKGNTVFLASFRINKK